MTAESDLVRELARRGMTVAVAESCTGGLLGARITSVEGSSRVFVGGVVAYSDRLKETVLGVGREALNGHGAVSPEVAERMLTGVLRLTGADVGIAVTGVAGPGGGTAAKPVGTVVISVGDIRGCATRTFHLPGGRAAVRKRAVEEAVGMLLARLGRPGGAGTGRPGRPSEGGKY